ncbi:hypothetical protein TBLA_0D02190 [Henningerozyma blattae CBS 6284]|uniref:Vitamin B6 transporter TPN1 n=1 Tax=Henningerozyma blattae (strain ATCC 34711 / CBS 6284 / DSM 70876 / NBRC 10599 / NRRL Y-10934 / UCD 77-7) TaxID=1071380 RepID=I2H2X2_HENB6|nr:hypothetical protein TBLA_0D02190 [Tetrapisispora blattae CBS 6284]CCH60724.1 hypothetical protein TBLA_0D02190 [Tetrapisispora blattae CBS 6284]
MVNEGTSVYWRQGQNEIEEEDNFNKNKIDDQKYQQTEILTFPGDDDDEDEFDDQPDIEHDIEQGQNPKKKGNKVWNFIKLVSNKIDSLGVESNGIDRIPADQRGTFKTQVLHVTGIWISATGGLSSMSSFLLGPLVFGLTYHECLVSGLVSVIIGCLVAAYCSIMGPQSGCRQMVTARYLFGWFFVKFIALAAIIGVLGWSVVNSVVGGEMLAVISNGKVPLWVGIVIVTVCSFVVATFGIKQVLKVETYMAIPVMTTFLLLYISSSDKFSLVDDFKNVDMTKATIKGNWMSYFSLCYSITSTWGSITADYYILFPEDVHPGYVFLLTFFGITIPTIFVGVLGILISCIAASYDPWNKLYAGYGMGGLLWAGFERWHGFGKFCVVVLVFSLVSNNIVNTYSAAFSIQLASVRLAKIPRWFWSIVATVIYLVCALVGRNHFSTILGNFLPMIGYWLTMYFTILFEENEIFRRFFLHLYIKEFPPEESDSSDSNGSRTSIQTHSNVDLNSLDVREKGIEKMYVINNIRQLKAKQRKRKIRYNWDKWNDPTVLTHGIAATLSFCCGVAGVVVGMAQVYWIGPVARHFGKYGGDLGMWLSMAICFVTYPPMRYIELKYFGR